MPAYFASLPGAVLQAEGPDAGAVWHFGNPVGEQRALESGRALVELAQRAVLTITGPDRLSWLNSISSQRLLGLQPGDSSETLLLDPSGRIEHAVRLVEDGETLWLIVDAVEAPSLLDFLTRMKFMLRVEIADVTAERAVIGSTVPLFALESSRDADAAASASAAQADPADVGTVVWQDPWSQVVPGGHQYAAADHDYSAWKWFETVVARDFAAGLAERVEDGHAAAAGAAAAEALRIAARRPRFATEVDERSIPHELDWLRSAVHLDKGCYRGQETVAKVHNLGHPPRRLVLLHLDGSDAVLPAAGDEVVAGDAVVGHVTSSALHHELGPVALAVVKRNTDASAELRVRSQGVEVAAAQEVVVPPSAGAEADVPRLPRLGAVARPPRNG